LHSLLCFTVAVLGCHGPWAKNSKARNCDKVLLHTRTLSQILRVSFSCPFQRIRAPSCEAQDSRSTIRITQARLPRNLKLRPARVFEYVH
jgi:hypothetical protein